MKLAISPDIMPKKTTRAQIAQDSVNGADENVEEQDRQAKRAKQSVGSKIADEFVCPISHNLPIDPVTAEDVSRRNVTRIRILF